MKVMTGVLERSCWAAFTTTDPTAVGLVGIQIGAVGRLEEARRVVGQAASERQRDMDLMQRLGEGAREMATQEARYRDMEALSEAADGRNPRRQTFHDSVLGLLLDQVPEAGNTRRKVIRPGRHHLAHGGFEGPVLLAPGGPVQPLGQHRPMGFVPPV